MQTYMFVGTLHMYVQPLHKINNYNQHSQYNYSTAVVYIQCSLQTAHARTCTLIVNEYNLLVEIQTLRYSAIELFVYEEDEQINVHFGPPKHRHGCQALVLQLKEVLCV